MPLHVRDSFDKRTVDAFITPRPVCFKPGTASQVTKSATPLHPEVISSTQLYPEVINSTPSLFHSSLTAGILHCVIVLRSFLEPLVASYFSGDLGGSMDAISLPGALGSCGLAKPHRSTVHLVARTIVISPATEHLSKHMRNITRHTRTICCIDGPFCKTTRMRSMARVDEHCPTVDVTFRTCIANEAFDQICIDQQIFSAIVGAWGCQVQWSSSVWLVGDAAVGFARGVR